MQSLLFALSFFVPVLCQEFEYNQNGADWTGTCVTGTHQSPINIASYTGVSNTDSYSPLTLTYLPVSTFSTDIEGHNYKILGSFGTLTGVDVAKTNNYTYAVSQFHFHAPSEHTLDGTEYPLEMHIVHSLISSSAVNPLNLAVLGVFFQEGAENSFLANILATNRTTVDISALLGTTTVHNYYMYQGSLTTPPCTEAVNWYVYGTVLTASAAQIQAFNAMWEANAAFAGGKGNNRNLQNLNGRSVLHYNDFAATLSVLGGLFSLSLVA